MVTMKTVNLAIQKNYYKIVFRYINIKKTEPIQQISCGYGMWVV